MNHPENMTDQGKRLIFLFKHADRFLFGLKADLGQRKMYQWLETKNFVDELGRRYKEGYQKVEDQMVENQGIRRIIDDLVIPLVEEKFLKKDIEYLWVFWKNGTEPTEDLETKGIQYKNHPYGGCSFLEMRHAENGTPVYRWTDWAKIYFSELINIKWESGQSNTSSPEKPIDPLEGAEAKLKATQKLFSILKALPYNSNDKDQQIIDKILVLSSLSGATETKPVFNLLSKIIDFGQLLALVSTKEGNSQIGDLKNE
jgi:hypothetical protein